jgi:hypothetical protein
MDQDTQLEEQTTEQAQQQAQPANLSLQDLLLVAQTIQVVAQRGVFRAEEMSNIGGLYERIVAFLQASGALKTEEASSDADATVTETVTDTQGE